MAPQTLRFSRQSGQSAAPCAAFSPCPPHPVPRRQTAMVPPGGRGALALPGKVLSTCPKEAHP